MNKTQLHLIILFAALLAASPLAAQPGRNHLWSSYDELESCTTVLAKVLARPAGPGRELFWLEAQAMIRDSARAEPVREVVVTAGAEQKHDEARWSASPELVLVLDDSVRLRYTGRYGRHFPAQYLPNGDLNRVWFRVPAADLRRIARASTVRGSALFNDFTLAPPEREALRQLADFVARSPKAPVPRPSSQGVTDCDSYSPEPSKGGIARPAAGPGLTARALGNLTYAVEGLEEGDSLTLRGGRFEGMSGGMRVRAILLDARGRPLTDTSRIVAADLDGDGRREGVVVLDVWLGGTGFFYTLVVVGERDGRLAELARAPLGDRVGIHAVETVATRAGPVVRVARTRGWCCPGERTVERYRFARARRAGARDALVLVSDSSAAEAKAR